MEQLVWCSGDSVLLLFNSLTVKYFISKFGSKNKAVSVYRQEKKNSNNGKTWNFTINK